MAKLSHEMSTAIQSTLTVVTAIQYTPVAAAVEALGDIQSSSKEAGELWKDLQIQNDIMAAAKLDSQPDAGGTKKRKGYLVA